MNLYQALAIIFAFLLVAYFIEVISLISKTKTGYPTFWEKIGSPDIFSPNGQAVFFAFLFGRKGYPENFSSNLMRKCLRSRVYLIAGIIVFSSMVIAMQLN